MATGSLTAHGSRAGHLDFATFSRPIDAVAGAAHAGDPAGRRRPAPTDGDPSRSRLADSTRVSSAEAFTCHCHAWELRTVRQKKGGCTKSSSLPTWSREYVIPRILPMLLAASYGNGEMESLSLGKLLLTCKAELARLPSQSLINGAGFFLSHNWN